jgi:hypothetical protein
MQTTCETNASGVAFFVESGDTKTILIGQNWQSHVKGGKPAGAYLSKGFTKYAFRVSSFSAILLTYRHLYLSLGPH